MYSLIKAQTFEWIAENEDEPRQNGAKCGHVMRKICCVQSEQYNHEYIKEIEEIFYGNSLGHFVPALIGEGKLSKKGLKISCNE